MVLSGLILLPLLSLPTLIFLRKKFQIKFFYTLVSFIHFGASIGLLSKYGYMFEEAILSNKHVLNTGLGLNYSLSASALDLLLCNLISLFYFLFGALNLKENTKGKAVFLMFSHSAALLTIFSDNLLLTTTSILLLLLLPLIFQRKNLGEKSKSNFLIYSGFAFLLGVSLVFGILYESIYKSVDLDLGSLAQMRTPFVKGSFYSTQFNLALLFIFGFSSYGVFAFLEWVKSITKGLAFNSFIVVTVVLYSGLLMFKPLFPEVYSVYMPLAEGFKLYAFILFGLMAAGMVFLEFLYAFSGRVEDV